ncbi:MAG: ribose 5-phosphate isomerase A [Gammaproteobacteria bacterium]|nr:ribose 5-phosphate isomerase A [Gammaproteobacteria bacterium]|tara:strand:- start:274 stop:927 length:654 start_codon:yes stop_codon:yes gene_type:complete
MHQDDKKTQVAECALEFIETRQVLGVGSGSTVNIFIGMLDKIRTKIEACVSSSNASTKLLKENNFKVVDLKEIGKIPIYVDGADEANKSLQLIKGGGGALTREKIISNNSEKFICIIDDSKMVSQLGKFPLPIEVIPMAQSAVALEMIKLGGRPVLRENFTTDNGNIILDVHNLKINEPIELEQKINNLAGVVTNGLFAIKPANKLLVADGNSVKEM